MQNGKLLPILLNLSERKVKLDEDFANFQKITNVFESYHFEVKSSQFSMNFSILNYIVEIFQSIVEHEKSLRVKVKLILFEKELINLKKLVRANLIATQNWTTIDLRLSRLLLLNRAV